MLAQKGQIAGKNYAKKNAENQVNFIGQYFRFIRLMKAIAVVENEKGIKWRKLIESEGITEDLIVSVKNVEKAQDYLGTLEDLFDVTWISGYAAFSAAWRCFGGGSKTAENHFKGLQTFFAWFKGCKELQDMEENLRRSLLEKLSCADGIVKRCLQDFRVLALRHKSLHRNYTYMAYYGKSMDRASWNKVHMTCLNGVKQVLDFLKNHAANELDRTLAIKCQRWALVLCFLHSLGQRREVVAGMNDETIIWTSDRTCRLLPSSEKRTRNKMNTVPLDDFLGVIIALQQLVIRGIIKNPFFNDDKSNIAVVENKALWIHPENGLPLSYQQVTDTVRAVILEIIPGMNLTPIDIRRYWASVLIMEEITVDELTPKSTLEFWCDIVNTSVSVAQQYYCCGDAAKKFADAMPKFISAVCKDSEVQQLIEGVKETGKAVLQQPQPKMPLGLNPPPLPLSQLQQEKQISRCTILNVYKRQEVRNDRNPKQRTFLWRYLVDTPTGELRWIQPQDVIDQSGLCKLLYFEKQALKIFQLLYDGFQGDIKESKAQMTEIQRAMQSQKNQVR
jgi:hypothetical protein